MASSLPHLSLLLVLAAAVTGSARTLPTQPEPATLSRPGPIQVDGRSFTKVCDRDRFAFLGLDIGGFAYCNTSLPYATRVDSLIGLMSVAEKVQQLGDISEGVRRIGLEKYNWWAEALHGISSDGVGTHFGPLAQGATSFANVILSAASFNQTLWKKMGQAVSTEGRALYNIGYSVLTFFSPNINVVRDPRWGRTLETAGEDPKLVGDYGVQFVRGLQDVEGHEGSGDPNARPLKVASCCKHYAAYDVETDTDGGIFHNRRTFDARVTEQDMVETFLRPFEMCVKEGDASSVMCSYNKINGVPSCVDTRLMKQTIRNEWNLHGYIVSDCDSLDAIHSYQHWLDFSPEEAVAAATRAGLDLDCGLFGTNYHKDHGVKAVAEGKLAEKDIDNSLRNLYMVLMRVGFFDNIPQYKSLGVKDICTPENIELARESARQGIVLLKNERNTLPLASTKGNKKLKVAVVGPHAQATDVMRGNYAGPPCQITSPENGISRHVNVITRLGCDDFRCKSAHNISEAVEAANIADATIIVTGLDPYHIEGEEKDRDNLLLPGYQTRLIEQVAEASNGPVVLVIMSGGGVDISFAQNNPKIGAIVWAGYPGQEGGHAIADVVFGRYNPGGRLPLTWYTNKYVNLLPITSMRLRPDTELGYPGRTYKFYDGPEILYPFGFGLSYTGFRYTIKNFLAAATIAMSSSHQKCKNVTYRADTFGFAPPKCQSVVVADSPCGETIKIDVQVTNTGTVDGTDVVLVYSKPPVEIDGAPLKQLAKYERVFVPAKSAKIVKFELNACEALGIVDSTAYVVLPAGKHMIQVGDGEKAVGFPVEIKF